MVFFVLPSIIHCVSCLHINRGPCIRAHALLDVFKSLRKINKSLAFFATRLIKEHGCLVILTTYNRIFWLEDFNHFSLARL